MTGGFLTHLRSNVNVAWELCHRQRASLMGSADSFVSKGVGTVTFGKVVRSSDKIRSALCTAHFVDWSVVWRGGR